MIHLAPEDIRRAVEVSLKLGECQLRQFGLQLMRLMRSPNPRIVIRYLGDIMLIEHQR